MRFQEGTFNTIGQRQAQFGGNFPVWDRVRELYKSGKTKCARFEKRNVQKSGKTKRSKKFAHTIL